MQYNSNASNQDIVSLANALCRQNNTSFPLTQKTLFANQARRIILTEIHASYGGWSYDDGNETDLPLATATLTADKKIYVLPTDAIGLSGVYVQNENDSEWQKLDPITLEEINRMEAEPSYESTSGIPRKYRAINNSIVIYPASNYTKSNAIKIEYPRDISGYSTTDTTKKSGFDPIFDELIAVYMALMFAKVNDLPMKKGLEDDWNNGLARVRRHYAQKWRDNYPTRVKINSNINSYI